MNLLLTILTIIAIWYVVDYITGHILGMDKKTDNRSLRDKLINKKIEKQPPDPAQQANEYIEKINTLAGKVGDKVKKQSLFDKLQGNNIYEFLSAKFFPNKARSREGKLLRLLLLIIGGIISLGGFILRFILRGLYKFFAFLGPTGHFIIRYSLYLPLIGLYDRRFGAEGYILIFVAISDIVAEGVKIYTNEEDEDYQEKMNKINMIFIIVLVSTWIIVVILRITGLIPSRELGWLTKFFEFTTDMECTIFQSLFHSSLRLTCS